jgi:hypothetical protein
MPLIPKVPFPPGLSSWEPDTGLRDLFAPPGPAGSQAEASQGDDGGFPGEPRQVRSSELIKKRRLHAILRHERIGVAVIDNQWLLVGDSIDGCTVTAVFGTEVEFRCFDGPVTFRLSDGLRTSPD